VIAVAPWITGTSFFRDPTYLNPSTTADLRTNGSVRHPSGFVQIAIALVDLRLVHMPLNVDSYVGSPEIDTEHLLLRVVGDRPGFGAWSSLLH
jgi:hypothetical protein